MATPYSAPRGNLPPNHPYASSSAGPSSYPSRQSSRDAFSYEQGGARADTERDRFGDAEGDCGRAADSDLQAEMTRFQPPPPRTMPHPHHQTYRQSPPTQPDPLSAQPFGHPTHPSGPSSSFSPGHELGTISRQRLPSSTSVSSMSSAMRERKALIPAALDLSPQSERAMREAMAVAMREERYAAHGRLGQGLAPVGNLQGQRAVTDSYLDQGTSQRALRPLPALPRPRSTSFKASSAATSYPTSFSGRSPPASAYPSHLPASAPQMQMTPSTTTAPPSAFGSGRRRDSHGTGNRLAVTTEEDLRMPPDSYPLRSPYLQLTPAQRNIPLSPTTPDMLDPSHIDRRTLIGVGELATPRWAASSGHQHLRTPGMVPSYGVSPPKQQGSEQQHFSPGRNWARGESGLGLGVGVMEGAKEGSPRGLRPRHQSVQYGAPPTVPQRRQSREYDEGRIPGTSAEREVDDLSSLLASGHLGDFDFDSSMTAALAASLSIANEPSPPSVNRRLEQRLSAPPPQLNSARPLDSSRRPSEERLPDASVQAGSLEGSPGSARSRIYARRQERERQATLAGQTAQDVPVIPQRSTSTFSPPDSADSQHFSQRSTRDVRQTPPSKEKEAVARVRQSPNAAHHDIFKHFAPKDFSHLPPSPSSASINQFLRGSGSVNNFASASTPPGTTMATAPSYLSATSVSTAPSRTSLPASDSGRVRSMPSNQKTGWEGRSLGAETAEALRKLDGLGSTPGKAKPSSRGKSSAGSAHSRPGTPPAVRSRTPSEKKLFRKVSTGSAKAPESSTTNDTDGSPLHTWVDVADDTPGIPVPQQGRQGGSKGSLPSLDTPVLSTEKRESPSSTSFVGTPNSRDSHSVPPTSTRPSSLSDQKNEPRPVRRSSGDSDESVYSDAVQGDIMEKDAEASVPPVPPLPKRYMSMRQGLSNAAGPTPPSAYITLQESSLGSSPHGEVISPELSATSDTAHPVRPRPMNKKWSFSSALSLRLNNRDSSQSPAASQSAQPQDGCESPQTPWSEIQHGELSPPARLDLSESAPVRQDNRSIQSITPVATTLAVPKPSVANKRLTPSSMPFFRRASSSSVQSKTSQGSVPETPKAANPPPTSQRMPSGSQARRSVLGMHLPSMLRGSASKRGLSQPLDQAPALERVETKEQPASTGWSGHKRGKTLSISADPPRIVSGPPLQSSAGRDNAHIPMRKPSDEGSLNKRSSLQSNHTESTVNAETTKRSSKSGFPPIADSPHLRHPPSSSSLKNSESSRVMPSATPTKVPRPPNRPSVPSPAPNESMPPPSVPHSMSASKRANIFSGGATFKTMTSTSSMADLSRPMVNEFGAMNGTAPRQRTAGSHRAHLLAPMSSRAEPKREKVREPLVRKTEGGGVIPPSRRNMPIPPLVSTSHTVSSLAKRSSREFRPGNSRRSSKDTGNGQDDSRSGSVSPIKPSKSLHSKLSVPASTRIPSSSSMGAPAAFRHTFLPTESQSDSPAEDEEAQGDAEMQAYVTRRRARRASGSGKKDDLADITAFPQDVLPMEPISQRAFISRKLASMSDFERREVLDFDQIWYSPPSGISRPLQAGGASYNRGYDDERGDYLVVDGDHLCYRYEVVGILGKGSFGQVVQCRDHKTGGSAAVKIIRNKKRFHAQALVEVKILQQLVEWDPEDKHYMVRMTDNFYFRGHLCIVTELLSINLYELIKANQFAGFSSILIRRFTSQMLASLQLMRSHRIVHCDLKPENILLCHPVKSGIKIIDFGSSCLETEKVYTYIQSRFYRSPEVIIGMNYAMAIDMWSLGCILAELYTGVPIFPGENEHEQLACIMEVLGVPDRYIVDKASRRKLFFDATGTARPFVNAKGKRRRPGTKPLAAVLKCDDDLFVDFIGKCLTWDPDKRLKPQPAMRHPWILAGRRRTVPASTPSRDERGSTRLNSPAQSMRASGRTLADLANGAKGGDKGKPLLISPPTPLMPRQAPAFTGHSRSNSRLPLMAPIQNSTMMSTPQVSLG